MKYWYIRKQLYQHMEFQVYFSWIFYHFAAPTVKIKKVEINKLNRTTSFMIHIFTSLEKENASGYSASMFCDNRISRWGPNIFYKFCKLNACVVTVMDYSMVKDTI